jgi:hypothetical protein
MLLQMREMKTELNNAMAESHLNNYGKTNEMVTKKIQSASKLTTTKPNHMGYMGLPLNSDQVN